MHPLLQRQFKRHLLEAGLDMEKLAPLLDAVNQAYLKFDQDRALLERSLDLGSAELVARNQQLQQKLRELALTNEEIKRLLVILDNTMHAAGGAALLFDQQGRLFRCNRLAEDLLHLPANDIAGHTNHSIVARVVQASAAEGPILQQLQNLSSSVVPSTIELHWHDSRIIELDSAPYQMGHQTVGWLWTFRDVTEQVRHQRNAAYLSTYDALTGLPNRKALQEQLDNLIIATAFAETGASHGVTLFVIDLIQFSRVNDRFGHGAGDYVLQSIAKRLQGFGDASGLVARLGANTFAVARIGEQSGNSNFQMGRRLQQLCAEPIATDSDTIHVNATVGYASFPDDAQSADDLYKNAEIALFHAKHVGAGVLMRFDHQLAGRMRAQQQLEADLRSAIGAGHLLLYYQPKYRVSDRAIIGCEALMRWRRDDGSWVSPAEFIPVAEQSGLIDALGELALHQACALLQQWQSSEVASIPIAVNLSARQLQRPSLADEVASILNHYNVRPDQLDLELTESSVMENIDSASALLHRLNQIGCKIAVDDFGTGYSSLAYLSQLPLNALKIDRSFISQIQKSSSQLAIVRAIISLAHSLGLEVIAEGVETAEMLTMLHNNGCDTVQGFYFSPAVPALQLTAMLTRTRPDSTP